MAFLFGSCPQCHRLLPDGGAFLGGMVSCGHCGEGSELVVFPALKTARKKSPYPEPITESSESGCLYHPANKASAICSGCGAFICQLCEIHLQADPVCPACLERQTKSGKNRILKHTHYLWDNIALGLAFYVPATFVFWFMSLFTAPCAIFLACLHWNDAGILRKPSRLRMSLAILLALLQVAGWVLLFLFLFNAFSKLPSSH